MLQGFVKIARWNDINYWAVKTTVEKAHKTLHKLTKKYEELLLEPVRPVLTDAMTDLTDRTSADQDSNQQISYVPTVQSFVEAYQAVPKIPVSLI